MKTLSKTRVYVKEAGGQRWILLSFRYWNIFCMKRLSYSNLSITENECHVIKTDHYLWFSLIASEVKKDLSSDMKSVHTVYWCLAFVVHIHLHIYDFLKSALGSSKQKWFLVFSPCRCSDLRHFMFVFFKFRDHFATGHKTGLWHVNILSRVF